MYKNNKNLTKTVIFYLIYFKLMLNILFFFFNFLKVFFFTTFVYKLVHVGEQKQKGNMV